MLKALEDAACRLLDRDGAWWGIRRLKPAPDRPYRSGVLLLVCLAYGLPPAGVVYALGHAVAALASRANPLIDDAGWLPGATAWTAFVLNALGNGLSCWLWNRRAFRLNPGSFRHPGAERRDVS